MPEIHMLEDDDESFCGGDIDPADVDWNEVVRLERLQKEALDADKSDWAMLGLLHEMYGQDLEVL